MNQPKEKITWRTEKRKINDLKCHPTNPRILKKNQHSQLLKSFKKFDYAELCAINEDGTILAGHQRISIMKELGWGEREIEVRVCNQFLDETNAKEYLLRSNKNVGEFDWDCIVNNFDIKELLEVGFDEKEILANFEIDDIQSEEENENENESLSPPTDENAITKLGDLYELNDHRLICGDSTIPENAQKVLLSFEPVLMVTDPPYGVEYDPKWRKEIKGKHGKGAIALGKVENDDKINWSLAWFLFPGNVAYIWHAGKYCSEVQKSLEEVNFEIVSQIIWIKQHFALSRGDYHWQHEPCWYAVKKGQNHNWKGARDQSTTWEISNFNCFGKSNGEDERTCHSTQKPLKCMEKPILNNSDENDYIYDPFLGSGTTLIACEKLNRKCIGIELSPGYCDVIVQRWINMMEKNKKKYKIKKNGIEQDGL